MPQKLRCEVTRILDHGERVYSVFLKPETQAPRFRPGQFLHLTLDEYQHGDFWPDSRPFSIASPPSERSLLRITYAVKGRFTSRMEMELHAGRQVWIKLPYGEFTVSPRNAACLLAGGTGMTAFTAFLSGLEADYPHPVYLFYGARRPDLLVYRTLAEAAARSCPNLRVCFLAEQGDASTDYRRGRIDLDMVWKSISDPLNVTYYLSGPPGMLQGLKAGLGQRKVADGRIMVDAWE